MRSIWTVALGVWIASSAGAQRVVRPKSLWGRVLERPDGFGFGGVELLATLVVLLLVLLLLAIWHGVQALRLRRRDSVYRYERQALRSALVRRERILSRVTYAAAPVLGGLAAFLAPNRTLYGATITTWIVWITGATVALGAVALIFDHASRRRLEL